MNNTLDIEPSPISNNDRSRPVTRGICECLGNRAYNLLNQNDGSVQFRRIQENGDAESWYLECAVTVFDFNFEQSFKEMAEEVEHIFSVSSGHAGEAYQRGYLTRIELNDNSVTFILWLSGGLDI